MSNANTISNSRSTQIINTNASSDAKYSTNLAEQSTANLWRIRKPSKHDVLSGRGGSVNAHPGNCQFRDWVEEYRKEYSLARSKFVKVHICHLVIDKVISHGGRFLTRESPNSQWWIEQNEERIIAKTSQALREGAPKIREAHRKEFNSVQQQRKPRQGNSKPKRKVTRTARNLHGMSPVSSSTPFGTKRTHETISVTKPDEAGGTRHGDAKRVRVSDATIDDITASTGSYEQNFQHPYHTEIMLSKSQLHVPTPYPIQFSTPLSRTQLSSSSGRSNSLLVSDITAGDMYNFVNPFDDESDIEDASVLTVTKNCDTDSKNVTVDVTEGILLPSPKLFAEMQDDVMPTSSKIEQNSLTIDTSDSSIFGTPSGLNGYGTSMTRIYDDNYPSPLKHINSNTDSMISTIETTPDFIQCTTLPHVLLVRSTSGESHVSCGSMNHGTANEYRYVSNNHLNHIIDDETASTSDQNNIYGHQYDDDWTVTSDTTLGLPSRDWFNRDEIFSTSNHHEPFVIV